jgi:hypothetical protein
MMRCGAFHIILDFEMGRLVSRALTETGDSGNE